MKASDGKSSQSDKSNKKPGRNRPAIVPNRRVMANRESERRSIILKTLKKKIQQTRKMQKKYFFLTKTPNYRKQDFRRLRPIT